MLVQNYNNQDQSYSRKGKYIDQWNGVGRLEEDIPMANWFFWPNFHGELIGNKPQFNILFYNDACQHSTKLTWSITSYHIKYTQDDIYIKIDKMPF